MAYSPIGDIFTIRLQGDIKKPCFAIQTAGAEITFLAGLYCYEEHSGKQIPIFLVIIREAIDLVRSIQDAADAETSLVRSNISHSSIAE